MWCQLPCGVSVSAYMCQLPTEVCVVLTTVWSMCCECVCMLVSNTHWGVGVNYPLRYVWCQLLYGVCVVSVNAYMYQLPTEVCVVLTTVWSMCCECVCMLVSNTHWGVCGVNYPLGCGCQLPTEVCVVLTTVWSMCCECVHACIKYPLGCVWCQLTTGVWVSTTHWGVGCQLPTEAWGVNYPLGCGVSTTHTP